MRRFSAILVLVLGLSPLVCRAQFRSEAFSQQYNSDKGTNKDSTDVLFSFKDYFGGLAHKNEFKVGVGFAGSMLFIGGMQIYNKDYWKLPVVYGGIGAGVGLGCLFNDRLQATGDPKFQTARTLSYVGAGLFYWGSLMDGVVNFKPDTFPHPGKATIYSILCPGLGQIYNKEYWKIPIYIGGMAASLHFYFLNRTNYERFQRIYKEATDPEVPYTGPINASVALYYRDVYRRYRDYSILAFGLVYLLQVIDANVFSYMHDFNVDDDITVSFEPSVISPVHQNLAANTPSGFGLSLGVKF